MRPTRSLLSLLAFSVATAAAALIAAEAPRLDSSQLSDGILTIADQSDAAYLQPAPSLEADALKLFAEGHKFFNTQWAFYWFEGGMWGRGPTSNADSCVACHRGNGRGSPDAASPEAAAQRAHECSAPPQGPARDSSPQLLCRRIEASAVSLIVRLSLPGENAHGGPRPHPHYGDQLQTFGVKGVLPAEGSFSIEWQEQTVVLADGEEVRLRRPTLKIADLAWGLLGNDVMVALRLAPPLIGLGLLEAVPEETILQLAARAPAAGISGHANRVWDESQGKTVLGRFGSKANHGSVREQVAAAFINDIGLSNPVYAEQNCPPVQVGCKELMPAGRPEITALRLAGTELYIRALSVPVRRQIDDPQVRRGERLFSEARCAVCHVPQLQTGEFRDMPQLAGQTIHPFTDLLVHDMGDELADRRPDFLASGRQWRTPPLWGIGLSQTVNGAGAFLHDGRARNFTEAILWHGGEALVSREAFRKLAREDREALIAFLQSL